MDTEYRKDALATFLIDDYFKWMADMRRTIVEPQWNRNYDAWRGRYNSDYLMNWKATEGNEWRSRVFVKLTKQKVLAAYGQVMSIMSQHGGIPWGLEPSPIPDGLGSPEEAKLKCENMRKQIKDDFRDGKADNAFRESVLEAAIYGSAWLRGPVIRQERRAVFIPDYGVQIQKVKIPKLENPGIWNVFWDMETKDINAGAGVFFREMLGRGRFSALKDQPGYDKSAIDELAQAYQSDEEDAGGSQEESEGPIAAQYRATRRVIPVYRFWGRVPRKHLEGKMDLSGKPQKDIEVFCTVAGRSPSRVIYGPIPAILPYRPIFQAKWQQLPSESIGLGIPEDMEDSQMIVNGLVRSMLDNKALSSNILMGWNPRYLAHGQNKSLFPGKTFEVAEHAESVRQGLEFFFPPDNTGNTMEMIEQFRNFADDETGISRMMEGGAGPKNKTAFEMSQIAESGNKLISQIISNIDEGFTEPIIEGFYHYHMLTNPDPSLKGDFTPQAKGFQSYMDKARRGQDLVGLLQFAAANEVTQNFVKYLPALRELASLRDFDPDEFIKSDEDIQQEQQQAMQAEQQASLQQMAQQQQQRPQTPGVI